MDFREVRFEIAVTERFHHFDGCDLVELAGEIAIVFEPDVRAIGDALAPESLPRKMELFGRDGDCGHMAAVKAHRMAGESAPAAADFEHAIIRGEAQLAAERVVFFRLRGFEGLIRRGEIRAGVGHRRVEPQTVEIVPEVVVLGDVLPRGADAVRAEEMQGTIVKLEQVQRECA